MGKSEKKKSNDNATVTNNVTVEIDYEKLADAIVKAQKKAEEKPLEAEERQKMKFRKAMCMILCNKKDTKDRMTMGLMAIPLELSFKVLAVIGWTACGCVIVAGVKQGIAMFLMQEQLLAQSGRMVFLASVVVLLFLLSLLLWGAANEMGRTNDKNFVAAIFSSLVGFAALILALIALEKGELSILNLFS